MTKPHFDRLLKVVVGPGTTPERVVQALSVGNLRVDGVQVRGLGRWFRPAVLAWRKLRTADRLKVAADYLARNPPPATVAEAEALRRAAQPKLFNAFGHDWASPSCSFYDAPAYGWTARREERDDDLESPLFWEPRPPTHLRLHMQFAFKSLDDIPMALVRLAVGLKLAFRLSPEAVAKTAVKYGCVLVPPGDLRAAAFADKPENVHEVPGVPHGMALLFEGPNPEDVGLISEWSPDYPDTTGARYGCSVGGRFYAIEIDTPRFDPNPRIPA